MAIGACVWAAGLAPAIAEPFSKPVRFVVPYPAGGPTDLTARVFADRIAKLIGQPLVVENKPGAQGTIAMQQLLQAPADGHAIYFGTLSTQVVFPLLAAQRKRPLPFDTARDFVPVATMTTSPLVAVVASKAGIASYKALVEALKSGRGQLAYGSDGIGSLTHLGGSLIGQAAGVQPLHVPYKGTAEYGQALLRGDVQFGVMGIISVLPLIQQGAVKPVAVAGVKRSPQLPDVPTTAESGSSGVDLASWFGVFMKAGTPRPFVEAMASAIHKAAQDEDLVRQLTQAGVEMDASDSPSAFAARFNADMTRWKTAIESAGIKADD
jgi:tripartite-type tricarboxylate transporter receptor subunit TctC